jgi:hypothetical protein
MYLRTVKAKGADGVEFEYIHLVEACWENGHSKQRVVANLGRKDVQAPHLESLIELLGGGKKTKANSLIGQTIAAHHQYAAPVQSEARPRESGCELPFEPIRFPEYRLQHPSRCLFSLLECI